MPAISVVVPVHNAARYLEESLTSIARQTFPDFELIAIDDGSTDASLAMLRKFAAIEPRMHILAQKRRGVAHALNRACATARGSYIARMDADDRSARDRLDRQHAFLKRHPDVIVLGSAIHTIDATGGPTGRRRFPRRSPAISRALWAGRAAIAHPTVMMRRSAFEQSGGYDPRFDAAEDYELWLRMLGLGQFHNLSRALLDYRVHPEATSVRRSLRQASLNHVARAGHSGGVATAGAAPLECGFSGRLQAGDPAHARLLAALGLAALRASRGASPDPDLQRASAAWLGLDTPDEPAAIAAIALNRVAAAGMKEPGVADGLMLLARDALGRDTPVKAAVLMARAARAHPFGIAGLAAIAGTAALRHGRHRWWRSLRNRLHRLCWPG